MNNGCSQIVKLLSAYYGRELDADKTRIVTEHIDGCESCCIEYQGLSEAVSTVRQAYDIQLPESEYAALREKIMQSAAKRRSVPYVLLTMSAACAAAAFIFCLNFFAVRQEVERPTAQTLREVNNKPFLKENEDDSKPVQLTFITDEGIKVIWIVDENFAMPESQ